MAWPLCQHQPWQADFFLRATVYFAMIFVVVATLGVATVAQLRPPWYQTMFSSYLQGPPSQQEQLWLALTETVKQTPQYLSGALSLASTAWTGMSSTATIVVTQ